VGGSHGLQGTGVAVLSQVLASNCWQRQSVPLPSTQRRMRSGAHAMRRTTSDRHRTACFDARRGAHQAMNVKLRRSTRVSSLKPGCDRRCIASIGGGMSEMSF
jgi:hypothetical protein